MGFGVWGLLGSSSDLVSRRRKAGYGGYKRVSSGYEVDLLLLSQKSFQAGLRI